MGKATGIGMPVRRTSLSQANRANGNSGETMSLYASLYLACSPPLLVHLPRPQFGVHGRDRRSHQIWAGWAPAGGT